METRLYLTTADKFLDDRSIHVQFSKREIPYDFLKFNSSHFTPQVRLFFVERRKPKLFGFKNAMERGIRKCLTFIGPVT